MKKLYLIFLVLCISFNWVSANYKRTLNDEIKLHELNIKIWNILDKYKRNYQIKEKIKSKIAEKLWKNIKEVANNSRFYNYDFKNFEEYIYLSIYRAIDYENDMRYMKLLENEYIKTISRAPDLHIDDKSVYWLYREWTKRNDYIYFFDTNKDQNVKEYILKNIFEKQYEGKCEFKEYTGNFIFTDNQVFSFQATDIYSKGFGFKESPDCWEFTHGYFERKSENLIIFVKFTYEYVWLDYSLIEVNE